MKRSELQRKTPLLTRKPLERVQPKPAKGPKLKKCANRECRAPYMPDPKQPFRVWCSDDCGAALALHRLAQQKAKQQREERARDKAQRDAMKGRPVLVREAQAAVNKYVRLRDAALPCISCGTTYPPERNDVWDAGHMRSAGSSPGTRFNTLNIHKQSVKCNQYLSSNALKYRIALIEKIGLDLVEKIESHPGVSKFSHEYLIRLKGVFQKRVRHLIKLRERIQHGQN